MNPSRRSFLQNTAAIAAAAVAAPYVITTPGLLMPSRKIWTAREPAPGQIYIVTGRRFIMDGVNGMEVELTLQSQDDRIHQLHAIEGPAAPLYEIGTVHMTVRSGALVALGDYIAITRS